MSGRVLLVLYLLIGCGAAVAVLAEGRDARRVLLAFAILIFWPFLLPPRFLSPPPVREGSARRQELERAAAALETAWGKAGQGSPRERALTQSFVARLLEREVELSELEASLALSPPGVRQRMEQVAAQVERELGEGVSLVQEMTVQLTLLRFSELGRLGAGEEREHVQGVLARIEALAHFSARPGELTSP